MPGVVQMWKRERQRESVCTVTRAVNFPGFAVSEAYAVLLKCCHWKERKKTLFAFAHCKFVSGSWLGSSEGRAARGSALGRFATEKRQAGVWWETMCR